MKQILFLFAFASALVAAEGNLRYTITVEKFKNEAGWQGRWNIGDGFTTMMINSLNRTDHFIVLGDAEMRNAAMAEQDLATTGRMAGGKKAPKMGRMTPAQLLVRGSITHVENTTAESSGRIHFKGVSLGKSGGKGEVNITMYLVDSETGQVKASTEVVGKAKRSGVSLGYYGSARADYPAIWPALKKTMSARPAPMPWTRASSFSLSSLRMYSGRLQSLWREARRSSIAARARACASAINLSPARWKNWSIPIRARCWITA